MSYLHSDAVIVFAKTPQAGKVKTRLAYGTSDDFAITFYQICLHQLFHTLKQCTADILLYLTPDSDADYFSSFQPNKILFQKGNDLGLRMKNALEEQLPHYQKVMLIGSDIPTINETTIEHAQTILDTDEAVIGPAEDGGYYLIGFKQGHFTDCFHSIQWSTNTVFQKTCSFLSEKKLGLLPVCSDVDTLADLQNLHNENLLPTSFDSLIKNHPNWF